jgi:ribosome-binding protein aMBF1 (putative translation factor)
MSERKCEICGLIITKETKSHKIENNIICDFCYNDIGFKATKAVLKRLGKLK